MSLLRFDFAPYRLSGVVYGSLLNHRPALLALGDATLAAPYRAPPQAPVLYVKPRNTLSQDGAEVMVPTGVAALAVGATLGVVIGQPACRLERGNALAHVAGYTVVNDVSVPHDLYYRPSIRYLAQDGFCPIGPALVPVDQVRDPDALQVRVWVDGECVQTTTTGERLRDVRQLLVDVTDFMSLQAGDVLMIGVSAKAPRVRAGQTVAIDIESVGRLQNRFVAAPTHSGLEGLSFASVAAGVRP